MKRESSYTVYRLDRTPMIYLNYSLLWAAQLTVIHLQCIEVKAKYLKKGPFQPELSTWLNTSIFFYYSKDSFTPIKKLLNLAAKSLVKYSL